MRIPHPGSFIITIAIVFICSCREHSSKFTEKSIPGKLAETGYSERLSLKVTDSCTIATISDPWQGANRIRHEFYLVNLGKGNLIKADPARIIYVPVKKIICMSATHLAMIKALGKSLTVTGVSGPRFIYDSLITERIKDGLIMDVGYESGLNTELILKLSPDLVMMYGIGSESATYSGKIEELGIKVLFNADYLEAHPLGKAEWIKLFGALYCREETADSIFREVERSYADIKSAVEQLRDKRPNVMLGLPFKDTWYISPGNSYVSRLISDAGGNYLWSGTESSYSMPLSIEDVFVRSLKAEFWFNTGTASTRNEILSIDPRLGMIPCFSNGNLYNNIQRMTRDGGNDYWESGTVNPDRILKDLASIMHPGLFPDHRLFYFKRVE